MKRASTDVKRRNGFTLTELIIVMGMSGVVLSVAVGMIHRVMHEQKKSEQDNVLHRVAERLSAKLREDVHSASRAEIQIKDEGEEDEAQVLVLHQRDETAVTYVIRNHILERTSTRENEPIHRDDFRFPDNYRFELAVESSRVLFTAFAIPQAYVATASNETPNNETANNDSPNDSPSNESGGMVRETDVRRAVIQVEATLGRDHRFLNAKTSAETESKE